MNHEHYIGRCYALARHAQAKGNHPFGALLVSSGEVVLEAENSVAADSDVTCHAELNLVRLANRTLEISAIHSATLYTSTEPCAMCTGAIYWSGIRTIVYGCSAQTLGEIAGGDFVTDAKEILSSGKHKTEVVGPILPLEGKQVHLDYWPTIVT